MKIMGTALIYLCSINAFGREKTQPLNVKLGLWETTATVTRSGKMPIPADALAKLSPEQRARIEERMKARSAQSTKTSTRKTCITEAKLQKPFFLDDQPECTQTVISSSGSKMEGRVQCMEGDVKSDGTVKMEVLDQENIRGSVSLLVNGGGDTANSKSTFTSKWISSSCGATR